MARVVHRAEIEEAAARNVADRVVYQTFHRSLGGEGNVDGIGGGTHGGEWIVTDRIGADETFDGFGHRGTPEDSGREDVAGDDVVDQRVHVPIIARGGQCRLASRHCDHPRFELPASGAECSEVVHFLAPRSARVESS